MMLLTRSQQMKSCCCGKAKQSLETDTVSSCHIQGQPVSVCSLFLTLGKHLTNDKRQREKSVTGAGLQCTTAVFLVEQIQCLVKNH